MEKNKRGQVTIFIIVAIVIVVIGVLVFLLWPRITSTSTFDVENPEIFMQDCVEGELRNLVYDLTRHGLALEPQNYAFYETEKIQYLCYTSEYNQPCIRSPPFVKDTLEEQVSLNIKSKVESCFDNLVEKYQSKAYAVELKRSLGQVETKVLPLEIKTSLLKYELTISKSSTERHKSFNIILNSNLYEVLNVASHILDDEANFGEADKIKYMLDNLGLEITGPEYTDGTKIYIIKDKKTKEVFQFASRSLVQRPGI